MYILDSSAIPIVLKRLKEKSVEALEGKTILDLTRYELGNAIWKEHKIKKLVAVQEAVNKAEGMAKILEILTVEKLESVEEFKSAMELAVKLKLTFYDASYLYKAKSMGLPLITEDRELHEKASDADVKTITVNELLKIY
ncbi:MAG: type II toxin-antitoxin system VapC family toxin [Candidatus Bathyarchaeia archaeon]